MNDTYRWPKEGWAEKEWEEIKEMEARGNESCEIDWELYWENRENEDK